jgi:potassium-transporting ATPase potassium-binding subunit
MTVVGWLQILLALALVVIAARPLGHFFNRVIEGETPPYLGKALGPVERIFYSMSGIDPKQEQGWLGYTLAMLMFSVVGFLLLYAMQRLQNFLPAFFNPEGFDAVPPDLAFNTSISFVTNTNWQAYGGETTMSHFVQMAGLTVHNFLSAATGIALAVAMARGFARSGARTIGNFWVDLTRVTLYVLLPLSIVVALLYVATGIPQTMTGTVDAATLDGAKQTIAMGPIAGQEAIKMLGTNGGGFLNVNSAHPYENPSALSNFLSIWAMLVVSTSLLFMFGRMIKDERQGRALLAAVGVLLVSFVVVVYWAETSGSPLVTALGVDPAQGNMEGKEIRFGQAMTALFVVATTGLSCGAVNAMHESLTPLGGLIPLFNIQLGEILPGGVGSGLYGILVIAIIAVFVAGLMVGRTPEYLGKKIETREMKLAMLAVLILPLSALGFAAVAAMLPSALASLANNGPHGLTSIIYAYASATGNNGSAFAGLNANTPWFNTTLGFAMLLGRFAYVVPVMAIAGSLAVKTKLAPSAGTFPTHGPLFVALLIGVILIIGGLDYFPALALGPIVEHFEMLAGKTF